MPFVPVETPKCPACGKSVYAAEERVAGGYKFHKTCFKCSMCNKALDSTNCTEHEKELFCKNCHGRKYGPKGYGFGGGAGCLSTDTGAHLNREFVQPKIPPKAPDGLGCPRCGVYVYAAEQMLARGKGYHRRCFKCVQCNKTLDSTLHCDGPDKDIYCRGCYAQKFGARGYGHIGISSLGLMSDIKDCEWQSDMAPKTAAINVEQIQAPLGEGCPRCGGVVFAAEQVLSKGRPWHRKCFKCRDCTKTLDSIIACDGPGPDNEVYCKTCYGKKWGPHGYGFACGSSFLQTDGITEEDIGSQRPFVCPDTTSIKAPDGEGCPRCGGAVFAAELQLSKGKMWHRKCFNCARCHRPLDSVLACDGPDDNIYCKLCYAKLYGPKGFGYGHTPTLVSTNYDYTPSCWGTIDRNGQKSENGCPRCGFMVFAAEQMKSKNNVWHKLCFYCVECRKYLDSTNLNDGPDGNIYCRSCYGKFYGPKGVGYGIGAGTLTMA